VLVTAPPLPRMAVDFEAFHRENPHVYEVLVMLTRQWVNGTGRPRIGIGALYERARWELAITTNDPDYRLNNNFRAFYARLIMYLNPELGHVFSVRSSEADVWAAIRTGELP
jgi:hypothetical protein